jgi:1-aminocyclopropane-1-carboxylate deaminase
MAIIKPVDESKIIIQPLPSYSLNGHSVSILRLDAIHPIISGNKWYKLKYNLEEAVLQKAKGILTFGGAFSNHLIASAAAAYANQLPSVAIVRGLQKDIQDLNPVLSQCEAYGMELHFVTRSEYAQKESPVFMDRLKNDFPDFFIIPEGGGNELGRKGMSLMLPFIPQDFTHILLSVGSGTTLVGLRNVLPKHQIILGFAPMKNGLYLNDSLNSFLLPEKDSNWCIVDRFHMGGFGKITAELRSFMSEFETEHHFPLDRVYTAKMMMGLKVLLNESFFPTNSKILCIHTGGLTGN